MTKQFRQGDVFIEEIDEIPADAIEGKRDDLGRIVLAYGEVTGHAHAIKDKNVKFFVSNDTVYLEVMEKSSIIHEEHAPIALEKKKYVVIKQKEFIDKEARYVQD